MHYRTLGKTGIKVSEIGYGAWGIGKSAWGGANDDESIKALNRSIEHGLNFIDTAIGYGEGHSERLVGQVVREHSEKIVVASKIPPKNYKWPAPDGTPVEEAYTSEHVIASTELSLSNLGLETIDVQQFHVWSDEWVGQGDWMEGIRKLKEQGKIQHFGVSINDHQPANAIKLIETGLVDTVQVIYNIFEQSPEDELLAACQKHNIGVIVRVSLDEGGLTGMIKPDSKFEEGDFREGYFRGDRKQEVFNRVNRITEDLGIATEQMAETALRYVLSHPAVSTVIPGMRTVRNVERNMPVGDGKGLSQDQLSKLKAHRWVRNFYK